MLSRFLVPHSFPIRMHVKKKLLLAACAALVLPSLAACSGTGGEELAFASPARENLPVDPSDGVLTGAIQKYLADAKGPKNSQYEYVRADLNGDGLREALVMFNLPHSYWCGWSGCTLAVFEAGDNSFRIVSRTERIRGPIVVSDTQTNGWDDIGVRLSGTDYADKNVLLRYDGARYPETPINELELPFNLAALGGERFFP